jgi:hypothetical protein
MQDAAELALCVPWVARDEFCKLLECKKNWRLYIPINEFCYFALIFSTCWRLCSRIAVRKQLNPHCGVVTTMYVVRGLSHAEH